MEHLTTEDGNILAEITPRSTVAGSAVKPRKAAVRYRHLAVPQLLDEALVESILETTRAKTREELTAVIASRVGYSASTLPKLRRRVARFERNADGRRRMPAHIKTQATILLVIDACVKRRFEDPQPTAFTAFLAAVLDALQEQAR